MRLGRRFVLLTSFVILLGGSGAALSPEASAIGKPGAAADQGFVRCANLSPGTPGDIYLYPFGDPMHPTVLTHGGYGSVSAYMPVSAGQYTVAMRPVGASASSPPSVSTSFMVSAGANYTVASIGSASARKLDVLTDQTAGQARAKVLVRVIQASLKQPKVTVSVGGDTLARELTFGSATSYQAIEPGTPTVTFTAAGGRAAKPVRLAAGSVHTIVVLDGASGARLKIGNLTDAGGGVGCSEGRRRDGDGRDGAGGRRDGVWCRGWPRWRAGCCWRWPAGSACAGRGARWRPSASTCASSRRRGRGPREPEGPGLCSSLSPPEVYYSSLLVCDRM